METKEKKHKAESFWTGRLSFFFHTEDSVKFVHLLKM